MEIKSKKPNIQIPLKTLVSTGRLEVLSNKDNILKLLYMSDNGLYTTVQMGIEHWIKLCYLNDYRSIIRKQKKIKP